MNNPTKSQTYSIGIEGRTYIFSPGSNMSRFSDKNTAQSQKYVSKHRS